MPEIQLDAKVVDRIHKLLALAKDGGATEAEASVAMNKAQELMGAYNLSMATLEAAGGKGEARTKEKSDKKLMFVWKRDLLEGVATANFCFLHIVMGFTKAGERHAVGYEIIGREGNIVATKQMFQYLLDTLQRLVVEYVGTNDPRITFSRDAHNFRLGAVARLVERLEARKEAILAEQEREAREAKARASHPAAATGNALVVVLRDYARDEDDLNNDLRLGREPGTTKRLREEQEARSKAYQEQRKQEQILAIANAKQAGASEQALQTMAEYNVSLATALHYIEAWERAENKVETPRQRAAREAKEARESERWYRQYARQNAHKHSPGYRAGRARAESVGLDTQIERNSPKGVR